MAHAPELRMRRRAAALSWPGLRRASPVQRSTRRGRRDEPGDDNRKPTVRTVPAATPGRFSAFQEPCMPIPLRELTPEQRAAIARDSGDRAITVAAILARHDIHHRALYGVVRAEDLPLRRA